MQNSNQNNQAQQLQTVTDPGGSAFQPAVPTPPPGTDGPGVDAPGMVEFTPFIDMDSVQSILYDVLASLFIQLIPIVLVVALVWGLVTMGVGLLSGNWRTTADFDGDGELSDEAVDRLYGEFKEREAFDARKAYVESYLARMKADVEDQSTSTDDDE